MPEPLIRPNPERDPPGAGGGLSKKVMGLPTWGWIAIAAAGSIVGILWLRSRNKSTTTTSTSGGTVNDTATAEGLNVEQYESLLALLRDIQGEVSKDDGETPGDGDDTPTPTPSTPSTPKPPPAKTPTARKYVKVSKFTTTKAAQGANWASTLSGIAKHEHTTVSKLLKLNPSIKNPNIIYANQKVYTS